MKTRTRAAACLRRWVRLGAFDHSYQEQLLGLPLLLFCGTLSSRSYLHSAGLSVEDDPSIQVLRFIVWECRLVITVRLLKLYLEMS